MTTAAHELTRYADIGTALADPRLVPLPAGPSAWRPSGTGDTSGETNSEGGIAEGGGAGGTGAAGAMAWLRATVARFSSGEAHARRRALVEADCARLDPAALRLAAAAGTGHDTRIRVVATLAGALGIAEPEAVARAVTVVAGAYFGGPGGDPGPDADPAAPTDADRAVARLMSHLLPGRAAAPPDEDLLEAAANRIGLLVQACDATADLVAHTRRAAAGHPGRHSVDALLAETLRHDPPVRAMRRIAVRPTRVAGVDITAGDLVVLDVAAANRDKEVFPDPDSFAPERSDGAGRPGPEALTFGAPPRLCPGRRHALALAAGVLDSDSEAGAGHADATHPSRPSFPAVP
ncbi:cytochrome P450 [Kitasatospora herbaricolor]|uniref:Cytochrome P450 n=1 Tax=Kitasatospora herbaricolor TaxID=68217 RepID=A0ABZ1WJV3_9ACTN|nr:cytochrome P450 [Kitasatospora herbaricolor]